MKRLFGLLVALAVVLAVAPAVVPASAVVPARAVAPAATSSGPAKGQERLVTLITGSQFAVGVPLPGRPASPGVMVPAPGACEQIIGIFGLTLGGTAFEIPYYALPYLGRGLDPRLFSVRALAGAERDGRLPVRIDFRGATPRLPGVTITSAAHGTAAGYLTASSAKVFGTALARQFVADNRGGYGTNGLFAGGTSISLATVTAGPAGPAGSDGLARQASPTGQVALVGDNHAASRHGIHLVTFRADNQLGHPADNGSVVLVSVDNSNFYEAFNGFTRGTAAFQAPAGHYFAIAGFVDTFAGVDSAIRWVVYPQITVTHDMTLRADERLATSEITMVTPRPATQLETSFEIRRTVAAGPPDDFATAACFETEWVNPTTTRPAIGKMMTFTSQVLLSPATARRPYYYNLSYQDLSGLIHRQRYPIRAASLATIQMRDHSAVPLPLLIQQLGIYPIQRADFLAAGLNLVLISGQLPVSETEYLTAGRSLIWGTSLTRSIPSGNIYVLQEDQRSYLPGERVTENWNAYPLHPAPDVAVPGSANGYLIASATRAGNILTMLVTPFTDNVPGHLGEGFDFTLDSTDSGTFEIDQNGAEVAGGDATRSSWQARLLPGPSTLRFVLDTTRTGAPYPLSTSSHTVWTWQSAPQPGATLPAGWTCPSFFITRIKNRNCSAQPLLSLNYAVAHESLTGSVPAGSQAVTIDVSHFQPSASVATITDVQAQVSFDDGATWQDAAVSRQAAGRFLATFSAPGTASFVALRVTAVDADGSTVQETLLRAYSIAS